MAVYAAMIEAIDTAVGTLVNGLEVRGVLDNTLIFFMSDNGANAESGPDGRFNGDPPGGPNWDLLSGDELGSGRQHAVPPVQTLHARGRHLVAAHRELATRHRGKPARSDRTAAGARHRHHGDRNGGDRREYLSEYKGRAIQPMEGVSAGALDAVRSTGHRLFWEHEGNRAVRYGNWKIVSVYPEAWELHQHRRRSRRAQERRSPAPGHRQEALERVGRVGQTHERGSRPGPPRLPWGDDASARGGRQGRGAFAFKTLLTNAVK